MVENYQIDFASEHRVATLRFRNSSLGVALTQVLYDDNQRRGWKPVHVSTLPILLPIGDSVLKFASPITARSLLLQGNNLRHIVFVERNQDAPLSGGDGITIDDGKIHINLSPTTPQRLAVDETGIRSAEQNSYAMVFEDHTSMLQGPEATAPRVWALPDKSGTIAMTDDPVPDPLVVKRIKLPQQSDVGQYYVQSNAQALGVFPYGNVLSFLSPISAEYWDQGLDAWLPYGAEDWRILTDNRGDTSVAVPSSKSLFRLTYQVASYHMSNALLLAFTYPNVNYVGVKLEESADNSVWVTRIAERTLFQPDQTLIFMDNGNHCHEGYVRVTFDSAGVALNISSIMLLTWRPGNQGGVGLHRFLPLSWDSQGALTTFWDLGVPAGGVFKVGGNQVVADRQPSVTVPDPQWPTFEQAGYGFKQLSELENFVAYVNSLRTTLDELRSRLVSHGLISS
jgi:hypothetical protein